MRLTGAIVKTAEFNNAGVLSFQAGIPKEAWEFFKGALEVKLAIKQFTESGARAVDVVLSGENRYVARAEQLLLLRAAIRQLLQRDACS
jgi:hypothetical protein